MESLRYLKGIDLLSRLNEDIFDSLSIKTCRDIYYTNYYSKGGGEWSAGEINKNWGLQKKMKKGKEIRRKITLQRKKRP